MRRVEVTEFKGWMAIWIVILAIPGFSLPAATISWANVGTDFATGSNWTGGNAPANSLATDVAAFATAAPTFLPNLTANRSVAGILFVSGAGAFTFSGTGTLSIGASGIVNSSASTQTLSVPIKLGLAASFTTSGTGALAVSGTVDTNGLLLTLNGAGAGAGSVSGVITGSGGVTKSGTGSWTLAGLNSYTGQTKILAGSLSINSLGSLGSGPSALGNPTTTLNGIITLGSTTSAATLTYAGPAALSNRPIDLGGTTGAITINASGTGALALTGGVTASGAGSKTLVLSGTNANENELGGVIADNSPVNKTSLSKTGAGTWKLSGANTFSGTTTFSAGILIAASDMAFGSGILSITGAGTLRGDGAARSVPNNINLGVSGATIGGASALTFNGSLTNTFAGNPILNITNTAPTIFTSANLSTSATSRIVTLAVSSNVSITGIIANGGGSTASGLTKTGAGQLTLSGANTYAGTTTLSAGTLRATTNPSALGTGALSLGSGTLELANDTGLAFNNNTTLAAGATIKVDRLTAGAGVTHTLGTLATASFTLNVGPGSLVSADTPYGLVFGATTLAGNPFTLNVANNGSATGTVTLGSLSNAAARGLTLTGPGTVVLGSASGAITSGTPFLINRGTLRLNATNALGTSALAAVTINDTAGATALLDLNGASQSILSLTFGGATATATSLNQVATGAGTLTLGGNVVFTATNNPLGASLSGKLDLGSATRTFTIGDSTNAATDLDVPAAISGSVGLTKTGLGKLTLSGANTFSGPTSISAGTLRATTNPSALGAGTLTLGAGILELANDTGLAFNNPTTVTAAAATTIKVDRLTAGPGVTHTLGTLTTATIALNVVPGSLVTTNTPYGLTFGAVTLAGGPFSLNAANNGSATGTVTLGALSNSSAKGLTLTGPGTIVLSSPSGTLTSGTPIVINAGTLRLGANNALGASALASITVNDLTGATAWLDLSGFTQSVFSLTFGGSGATGTSVNNLTTGAGTLTLGGNVTYTATNNPLGASLTGNLSLGTATRTFTIADSTNAATDLLVPAIVSGTGGLAKAGAGRLDLTAANTYSGTTTLSAGTLGLGNNTALGLGLFTLAAGSLTTIGGPLIFANNFAFASASTIAFAGPDSLTFNGTGTFTGTDTIANSTTVTLGGNVSGTGALVHNGSGTLILGGSNTFSGGTTLNGGTIRASNSLGSATGTGAVSVGALGTIAGTGRVTGALTLNGSISPGGPAGSGPGLLSTGNETWNSGGHYLWDLKNATGTAGSAWDKISLTGSLTIAATNAAPFIIDLTSLTLLNAPGNAGNFSGAGNYSWVIASVTVAISGFTGDKFIINTANFTNSHPGTFSLSVSGTDLLLNYTAVPEAKTWGATMSMGMFLLLLLRRRSRS